jgi:hypothetical protein
MTDQQLRDEVITFFLAGYETTATTLAWLVHTLTQHPQALRAVEAELSGLLGERAPAFHDVMAMPYTRAVIQETLRLYAPSLTIPRTAAADDEIDGYRIPADATVLPFVYGVHHNPGVWDDPERFDPSRFLGDAPEGRHRQAWIPFGAGQRQCIGRDLSLMETQIILPILLQGSQLLANCNGFQVFDDYDATIDVTNFFDNDGNFVEQHLSIHGTDTYRQSVTGQSITMGTNFMVHIDKQDMLASSGGLQYHLMIPGLGHVLLDAGRTVFDSTGALVFSAGPHQVATGDTAGLCAAFP